MATEQQRAAIRDHLARVMTPELAEVFMESYPPHRWDDLATKDDIALLRADLDEVKSDVSALKSDVSGLTSDVSGLTSDVSGLTSDVAGLTTDMAIVRTELATIPSRFDELEERVSLRQEAMEHRLTGEMRQLYVDQTRLLFFAMIGAIFTTATLAFAAVRF